MSSEENKTEVQEAVEESVAATEAEEVKVESVDTGAIKAGHLKLVDTIYTKLRESVDGVIKKEGISVANIITIIDAAMRLVGSYKYLGGHEKKAIAVTIVKKLIEESDLKPEDEALVKLLVERALDPAIDQLFALAPKAYGKVKAKCLKLFKKC